MPHHKEENKFSLFISSCFYEVKAYAPYITSLTDSMRALDELKVPYTYQICCNDSYVSRAKNSLVHQFLKSDFTHLMIIDSDETWNIEGFVRLIQASMLGFEVVAGLYPCKNNWEFYGGWPHYNEDGFLLGKEIDGTRVLDMQAVPGGFIIYSMDAFERTRPFLDSYTAPETGEDILEVFQDGIEFDLKRYTTEDLQSLSRDDLVNAILERQRGGRVGGRIGEDIYFQRRYFEAGGKIWCVPDIDMGHIGIKEWRGNYHKHLMECRGVQGEEAACA